MPRSPAKRQAVDTRLQSGRKSTQRERLIAGVIAVANREAYTGTTVSAVIAEAKVSKPTFYEYFRDREECFAAAASEVYERLLAQVRSAVAEERPENAALAGIGAIIAFAGAEPERTRFLTNEALGGGSAILDLRDQGIAELAGVIDAALDVAAAGAPFPDLPLVAVIGGIYRMLASRLRRGERATAALRESVSEWLKYYEVPAGEHRWRSLEPNAALASAFKPRRLRHPEALPPGRPRLSKAEIETNQRLRIILAVAALTGEQGYAATTVAEIVKRARVDLKTFYALFAEKLDALIAFQELALQEMMAIATNAFFADMSWLERCWEHGRVFLQAVEAGPRRARVAVIEAYAAGPRAAQRVEETYVPYTIFLQEGLRYATTPNPPSHVALEAINATYFELCYHQLRASGAPRLYGLLPDTANLWFCPFIGPVESNRFIDEKLNADDPEDGDDADERSA